MKKYLIKALILSTFFLCALPGNAVETAGSAAVESAETGRKTEFAAPVLLVGIAVAAFLLISKNHHHSSGGGSSSSAVAHSG